jgi:hypothetical protein
LQWQRKRATVEKEAGEDERKVVDTYYCLPKCGAGAGAQDRTGLTWIKVR